jgi:hypothetical protein
MANQKLEWLKDYKEHSLALFPVQNRTGPPEFRASNELIEYKKGEIINVEKRDSTMFRDVNRGIFFIAHDPSAYRLL